MDPLTLLRDFNVNQKLHEVRVEGDQIKFGTSYVFPRTAFTAFKGERAGADYYQLESVLFVVQQRQKPQHAYLTAAKDAGLVPVPFIDRRKLLDYLDGKAELQLDTGGALLSRPLPAAVAAPEPGEPAHKKARLEGGAEAGATKLHGQFERELRDRNTMLHAPTKQFESVFNTAKQVYTQLSSQLRQEQQRQQQKQKEMATADAKRKQQAQAQAQKAAAPVPAPAPLPKPVHRLERDSTADQLKAMGGEAAANIGNMISIYGYAGTDKDGPALSEQVPAPPSTSTSTPYDPTPARPAAPPSTSVPSTSQPAPSKQQPKPTAKPPLPGAAPPKPHSSSSTARHQHEKEKQHQLQKQKLKAQQQQQQQQQQQNVLKPKVGAQPGKQPVSKPLRPIIIVPSGMTATITMFNARAFLEEGRYEPSAAAQARGQQKQTTEQFKRTALKPPGQFAMYELTDRPPPKGSKDWDRVVAVVVQGVKWQFKDWIFKGASQGDLAETFQKVAGFYIHFADEQVPELVANWNIKCLGLTRERRHMDMTVALDFYRHLDAFLYARRSDLAY